MRRSKWLILFACIAIGWGGYWYFFMKTSSASVSTNLVTRVTLGSISSSVKTTGKISPIQTTSLPFAKKGIVTKIEKKVGDQVNAGEIIAEIDTQDAAMNIRNAQINLDNARNNFNKLFTSTSEADKLRSKTTYEESKNTLALLESQYLDFITNQKNTLTESLSNLDLLTEKVKLAESELEYVKKNTAINNDSSNLERDMANAFLSIEEMNRFFPDAIKSLRDLLYIENKNSDYYGDLGATNSYQKANTEKLYASVSGTILEFQKSLSPLRTKDVKTLDEVFTALTSARNILSDLNTLSAMAIEEYANSHINITISQTFIDSQQTLLRTLGSTISTKLSSLNSTYTTLKNYGTDDIQALANKNSVSQKEQALQSVKNDYAKADRAYQALLNSQSTDRISKQNEIARQKNTVTLNELTYQELIAWPESADKKSAENNISAAEINLTKAYIALKDYQIIAPFDGTINDIPWIVGDTAGDSSTTSNTEEGILIENKNLYEIGLSLDQIDIVKIKPGMQANITLDAFPGEAYTGSVSSISALPTETSGVVSYEAKIILTLPRTDVFSKMSATVEIITTAKENIIVIPTSSIISEWGKSYVNRAKDPSIYDTLMRANRPSGSGGVPGFMPIAWSGDIMNTASGSRRWMRSESSGSGSFSGSFRSFSGGGMASWSVRWMSFSWRTRPSSTTGLSTTESIPTEKIEVTLGLSSDGKTEIVSGLSLGDIIVSTSKTGISTKSTSTSSSSASSTSARRATWGFGWPPPGF